MQPTGKQPASWKRFRPFVGEALATLIVFLAAFLPDDLLHLRSSPLGFITQDATRSFEVVTETIPTWLLSVIVIVIPIAILLLVLAANFIFGPKLRDRHFVLSQLAHAAWLLLCWAQGLLVAKAITDCVKIAVGYQRPNFFGLCNYAGYQQAYESGNYSSYFASAPIGRPGDLSNCQASTSLTWKAQRSFPSGHSSESFAAMLFVTLVGRAYFNIRRGIYFSLSSVLTASPLVLAAFVAISRVRDKYHDRVDISVGCAIGVTRMPCRDAPFSLYAGCHLRRQSFPRSPPILGPSLKPLRSPRFSLWLTLPGCRPRPSPSSELRRGIPVVQSPQVASEALSVMMGP
jgi:membrane-associated phospholipid phosphatase